MLYVEASFEEVTVRNHLSFCLAWLVCVFGCGELETETSNLDAKQASAIASFYNFKWAGEVYSNHCYGAEKTVDDQLLYTVGQLNGKPAGRLDQVRTKMLRQSTPQLAVSSRTKQQCPSPGVNWAKCCSYELILPRDLSEMGLTPSSIATNRAAWIGAHTM